MRQTVRGALAAGLLAAAAGPASAHGVKPADGVLLAVPFERAQPWFLELLLGAAEAEARVTIDKRGGYRTIKADGMPDHQPGRFPNPGNPHSIRGQNYGFRVPLHPRHADRPTPLGHQPFGVAINGVVFDPLTAEYWNGDRRAGWNIEALSGAINLGLDAHNAHVQPDGAYHYHGVPAGLLQRFPYRSQPILLGWAADGFAIYGPYGYRNAGDAGSPLVELRPSFRVKRGSRPDGPHGGPGGAYDGTYVQDYEYVAGLGDLDACNGRGGVTPEQPKGGYHYVLSGAYPFIPRCFRGTPDSSFARHRPSGGGPNAGGNRPDYPGATGPGPGRAGAGPRRPGPPDLRQAAAKLGVSVEKLRRALGPPPPDFAAAAGTLGISVEELMKVLPPPPAQERQGRQGRQGRP